MANQRPIEVLLTTNEFDIVTMALCDTETGEVFKLNSRVLDRTDSNIANLEYKLMYQFAYTLSAFLFCDFREIK